MKKHLILLFFSATLYSASFENKASQAAPTSQTTEQKTSTESKAKISEASQLLRDLLIVQQLCTIQEMVENHMNMPGSNLRLFLFWGGIKFLTNLIWKCTTLTIEFSPLWESMIQQILSTITARQTWISGAGRIYGNGWGTTGIQGWRVPEVYRSTAGLLLAIKASQLYKKSSFAETCDLYLPKAESLGRAAGLGVAKAIPINMIQIMSSIKDPSSGSDDVAQNEATTDDNSLYDVDGNTGGLLHAKGVLLPRFVVSYDSIKYFQQSLYIAACQALADGLGFTGEKQYLTPYSATNGEKISVIMETLEEKLAWMWGSGTLSTNWNNPQLYYHFYLLSQSFEASALYDDQSLETQNSVSKHSRKAAQKIKLSTHTTVLPALFVVHNLVNNLIKNKTLKLTAFNQAIIYAKKLIPSLEQQMTALKDKDYLCDLLDEIINDIVDKIAFKSYQITRIKDQATLKNATDLLQALQKSTLLQSLNKSTQSTIQKTLTSGSIS